MLSIQFDVNIPTVFFFSWPSPYFKVSRIARILNKSILYGIWCFLKKTNFFNYVVNHRSIIKFVAMLNAETSSIFSDCQKVASWTTGCAEIQVPVPMELLILNSSCSPLSSTTLSVRCMQCLRPRVIFREYPLIMDFVVRTLWDNSS